MISDCNYLWSSASCSFLIPLPFTRVSALQLISLKWMMNNCTKQINCILGDEVRDADRRQQGIFYLTVWLPRSLVPLKAGQSDSPCPGLPCTA